MSAVTERMGRMAHLDPPGGPGLEPEPTSHLPEDLHPDDRAAAEAILRMAAGGRHFTTTLLARSGSGAPAGEIALTICSDDHGVRVEAHQWVGSGPSRDPLTGVAGAGVVPDRIGQALAATAREGGWAGVILVDVDGFRVLSDAFGARAADEILCWVGGRLASVVRPADTVARLGGDRFAVVVPGLKGPDDLHTVSERLSTSLDGAQLRPVEGLSAGIGATAGRGGDQPDDLLEAATVALRAAKRAGRGQVRLFDEDLGREMQARRELASRLHLSLQEGGLALHYQPVVELADGRRVAAEALVRMTQRDGGVIGPADLLATAAEQGLAARLEEMVLTEACTAAAGWPSPESTLCVAVNVSGPRLGDVELTVAVARALRSSGLDPGRLWLEVPEAAVASDPDATRMAVDRLRALGVRVAIDHFRGSGVVLAELAGLGASALKLDRLLVEAVDTSWGEALITATVARAAEQGLPVVAVGIRSPDQRARLQQAGCRFGQGFLFGHPAPPPPGARTCGATPAG